MKCCTCVRASAAAAAAPCPAVVAALLHAILTHHLTHFTVHALLLTICQMLREGGARIQMRPDEHCVTPLADYHLMEAKEAFERVARDHGWATARRS